MASFFPYVLKGEGSMNWTVLWMIGFILAWQALCAFIYYILYLRQRIKVETSKLTLQREELKYYIETQPNHNNEPEHSINTTTDHNEQWKEKATFTQLCLFKLNRILCKCTCCMKLANCITLRKYNNNSNRNSDIYSADEKYKQGSQRYTLWITGHTFRILFLVNAISDTFIQLTTQSVSNDEKYIFFDDTLLFKPWNCRINGSLRIFYVANSLMICSLFNWSKAASIFVSKSGNTKYGDNKTTKYVMKYGFIYIMFVNPLLCGIGLYDFWMKTEMNAIKLTMGDDYYCIITFAPYLFILYLAHDIIVNFLLIILFVQPLYAALKRHKYVSSPYHFNCSPNEQSKQSPLVNSKKRVERKYQRDVIYGRLRSAILRNAFAGIATLAVSTMYFMAFMYATFWIENDEKELWAKGYILSGNAMKYLLTFLFMTLTYRDWKHMFFPICFRYCCKRQSDMYVCCSSTRKSEPMHGSNRDSLVV